MSGEERTVADGGRLDRREDDAVEVVDLHEGIARELAEPEDGYEAPPIWLLFFILAVMGFGGWYLGMFGGAFDPGQYDERGWSQGRAPAAEPTSAPVDQLLLGRRVFANCAACHQREGTGVSGNYPPLGGSSWVNGPPEPLAALVLHGAQGSWEAQGATYNQVMPSWSHLTDQQIAAVLTFVRGSWGNSSPQVGPEVVAAVRAATEQRSQPWTAEQLAAFAAGPAASLGARADTGGDAAG